MRLGLRTKMAERLTVMANTWGHQQARSYEELTKSRRGEGGLGERVVEDDDDTR
jgi:hypothetical protein